jgi:putative membrane protein
MMRVPFLSDAEREAINREIAAAEKNTCAEIVPAIAASSGRYDRAEDLGGLLLALVAFTAAWLLFQRDVPPDEWNAKVSLLLELPALLAILVGGFILGAFVTSRVSWLRRLLATRSEMEEEVVQRAWETFARCRIGRTAEGTGILIYISLFERMVCVLGDDAVAQKLGDEVWTEIKDVIVGGLRSGEPASAIVAAVRRSGELLTRAFPVRAADVNELVNEIQFV